MRRRLGRAIAVLTIAALPLTGGSAARADEVTPAPDAAPAAVAPSAADPTPEPTESTDPPQATPEPSLSPTPTPDPTPTPTPTSTPEPSVSPTPEASSAPPTAGLGEPPPALTAAPLLATTIVNPAADNVAVAWVDNDPGSAEPATLPYTLQQALSTAAATGGIVHVVDGELGYTKLLTVPRSVTVLSAGTTRINALWSIAADGVTFTQGPTVSLSGTAANSRSVMTVPVGRSGVTLNGITIVSRAGFTGTTGILANSTTGLTVNSYSFDGGAGHVGNYGISARAASGMVVAGATITNVGVGYFVHGSESPAVGVKMSNVTIGAATYGVQVGGSVSPEFRNVTITTPAAVANAAAIDLATSTGAVIDGATLSGFAYGVKSVATSGAGAQISHAQITATNIGVSLGTTTNPSIVSTTITGGTPNLNTSFGIESTVTGLTLTDVTIDGFPTGMRTRATSGIGTTATNLTIKGATFNGLSLGTTDGNTLTNVQVLANGATPAATSTVAIQLGGSQHITITGAVVDGYPVGIGTGGVVNAGPVKQDLVVTGSTFTNVTGGISSSNFNRVTVRDVTVTTNAPKGSGVYNRENANVLIENLTVNGTHNLADPRQGTYGVRTYFTRGVTVRDSTFNGGGAGLYWDMTEAVFTTNIEVTGQDWYGVYAEVVLDWTMEDSSFHDNAAIGNLTINPTPWEVDPRNRRESSSDVHWTRNTFTNHPAGLYLPLGFGGLELDHNTVSGVPARFVVGVFPAHNIDIHDNDIAFTPADDDSAAILVGSDVYSNLDTDDYTSSGIQVTGNTFSGPGTFVRVGSVGGVQTALSGETPVMVTGNVFPTDSVAIDVRANSGRADTGITVDARDYDRPNDWGSVCRPRVPATGYDGGGAFILEDETDKVLYPVQCIELTLTESAVTPVDSDAPSGTVFEGDLVTWTLTPRNIGLIPAPAGWTVTQLLPDQLELVEMTGDGYTFDGLVATADDDLPVGEDGPVITVVARVRSMTWQPDQITQDVHNVAYIAPLAADLATDLDGDGFPDVRIENVSPLVVPAVTDDTDQTATNNDTQGVIPVIRTIQPDPEPDPDPTPTPTPSPTPAPAPTPDGTTSDGTTPGGDQAARGGSSSSLLARAGSNLLAFTGDNIVALLAAAGVTLLSGGALLAVRRRHASHGEQ